MEKKRDLSDLELLSMVLKDVTPLPGRTIKKTIKANTVYQKKPLKNLVHKNVINNNRSVKSNQPYLRHGDMSEVDGRLAQRMKRGKMQIEAKLDLHGYHQHEAHLILLEFIARAWKSKKRCLLVITGKGLHHKKKKNEDAGVLQKMVPAWLNEEPNRSKILSFSYARPSDGGTGALYVLLKRQRAVAS